MSGRDEVVASLVDGGRVGIEDPKQSCISDLVTHLFNELVHQNSQAAIRTSNSWGKSGLSRHANKIPRFASQQHLLEVQESFQQEVKMLNASIHDLVEMSSNELRELTG